MNTKIKLGIAAGVVVFLATYLFEAVKVLSKMPAPEAAITVAAMAAFTAFYYFLGHFSTANGWNRLPFLIGAISLVLLVLSMRAASEAMGPEFNALFWALLNFGPAFVIGVQLGEWNYENRSRGHSGERIVNT